MRSRFIATLVLALTLATSALAGDEEKEKELRLAAAIGDVETITALLDEGVDVNTANKFGKSALMVAIEGGDMETAGRVDVSHDMTRFDAIRLKQLIENHLHYTASPVARRVLDDWDNYLPKFVKVMPVDYRRALTEMQAQQRKPPQAQRHLKGVIEYG